MAEAGLYHCPSGDDTRGRGEGAVFRVNFSSFLLGLLNVTRWVRYLRIGCVSYGMPLQARKLLQGIAHHGIPHVTCLSQSLKFVVVSGIVKAKEISGHNRISGCVPHLGDG